MFPPAERTGSDSWLTEKCKPNTLPSETSLPIVRHHPPVKLPAPTDSETSTLTLYRLPSLRRLYYAVLYCLHPSPKTSLPNFSPFRPSLGPICILRRSTDSTKPNRRHRATTNDAGVTKCDEKCAISAANGTAQKSRRSNDAAIFCRSLTVSQQRRPARLP